MDRNDVDNLFELLRIFRPDSPKVEDKKLRAAWLLVLQPFSVDRVREAVAQYFREEKFFPDVSDIAKRCRSTAPDATPEQVRDSGAKASPDLLEWWADRKRALREAGLPTAADAMRRGMRMADHMMLLEQAGL